MKKYNITVNGISYEVEVEEVKTSISQNMTKIPPIGSEVIEDSANMQTSVKENTVADSNNDELNQNENVIKSPGKSTVLEIKAEEGQAVKQGDIVIVLESMGSNSDITAPKDGIIKKIYVSSGTIIEIDSPMFYIE